MAIHSSILAWESHVPLAGYSPWDCKDSDMTERLTLKGQGGINLEFGINRSIPLYITTKIYYITQGQNLISCNNIFISTKLVEVMEFQLSYFKSWKMMLWKCCTQYASKFGKLTSGHRTGKGQFSFQSQKKAIPKNAQATAQLHSSHTLVK